MVSNTKGDALLCLIYKKKLDGEEWQEKGEELRRKLDCEVGIWCLNLLESCGQESFTGLEGIIGHMCCQSSRVKPAAIDLCGG